MWAASVLAAHISTEFHRLACARGQVGIEANAAPFGEADDVTEEEGERPVVPADAGELALPDPVADPPG